MFSLGVKWRLFTKKFSANKWVTRLNLNHVYSYSCRQSIQLQTVTDFQDNFKLHHLVKWCLTVLMSANMTTAYRSGKGHGAIYFVTSGKFALYNPFQWRSLKKGITLNCTHILISLGPSLLQKNPLTTPESWIVCHC